MNYILSMLVENKSNTSIVLVSGINQYSYAEVYEHAVKMHSYLRGLGVRQGDRMLVAFKPGIEFVTLFYASIMIRAQIAIVDPHMGHDLFVAKIKQLQPQWLFCDSRLLLLQEHPLLRWVYQKIARRPISVPRIASAKYISVGPYMPLLRNHYKLNKYSDCIPLDPDITDDDFDFFITYTSGTLSEPKGVLHSLSALTHSLKHIVDLLKGSKKIATALPHFALIGICAGLRIYMWEENWTASQRLAFIERNEIDTLFGPPVEYQELMNYCDKSNVSMPATLSHIVLGSAPVHKHFLSNLIPKIDSACRVTCLYGMTENLVASSCDGRLKFNSNVRGDLLGRPLPDVDLRVDDTGEIYLRSPQMYQRYLHCMGRNDWHATGDLGRIDEDGNLILTGRKKDMIIRRNFNIYPALYEPTIEKIAGVNAAVMVGIYDEEIADEKVVLVVETDRDFNAKNILKVLTNGKYAIDKEAIPDEVVIGKIYRSGRQQKLDRKAIKNYLKNQLERA